MVEIFLFSLILIITFSPIGSILTQSKKKNTYNYSKDLVYGLIVICFIALFINFFLPLNIYINSIIPVLGFIIILKEKKKYLNLKFCKYIIFSSLLITILVLESEVYRPDAGLYHLPYIGILNSEKIIIGLSNIHFRYGHTSIIQHLAAISNNIVFKENGIVYAQTLIAVPIIINFFSQINNYRKSKSFNFHFFYLLIIFIYIAYKMNRYSEYGNDAPAHFLAFFLISEIIKYKKIIDKKEFVNNLILTLFIIQNKLTLLPIFLFNVFGFFKINIKEILFEKKIVFLTIFFILWIFKNVLTSGCILYPISSLCVKNLEWTNIKEIEKVAQESEAWSKGYSDLKIKDKSFNIEKFNSNFNWIEAWSTKHLKVIFDILYPYVIFLLAICLWSTFFKSKKQIKIKLESFYLFMLLLSLSCTLIWFFKSPIYRYGYSFIVSFFAILFSIFFLKIGVTKNVMQKITGFILILTITVFFGKNIHRINNNTIIYNNFPWPKFYSMDNQNLRSNLQYIQKKFVKVYYPNEYCMYSKNICGHYKSNIDKVTIKKKFNYLIIKN